MFRRQILRLSVLGAIALPATVASCTPAKTPSEECRNQNAWRRFSRGSNPDPRLDALEEMRCDEMAREERREAREDAHRAEDKAERQQARQEYIAAVAPKTSRAQAPREAAESSGAVVGVDVPDVSGLWIGDYGHDRIETIRIVQEGARVVAIKVTGDENVPAGKPTFRASLVGAEGTGAVHGADAGYQNPRWAPARVAVLGPDTLVVDYGAGQLRFKRMKD